MKTFTLLSSLILLIILLTISPEKSCTQGKKSLDPVGTWQGALDVGGQKLRMIFKISQDNHGNLAGKLDVPDQGASDIGIDKIDVTGDSLYLQIGSIGGVYTAKLVGSVLKGKWMQNGVSLPLEVEKTTVTPEVRRPQVPKKPYPYNEEEVAYDNPQAGIKLAGTLTTPKGSGQFPAVLLITGSGAQDRDESLMGHKPFLILADYLTRCGIAVLRVDDRGVGGSTGDMSRATTENFAGDVIAGVHYLKNRKEIDPKNIGLIGHSEGGIIAPMVASKDKDVAFIVLMAGTALTGEEILYLQSALIAKAAGSTEDKINKERSEAEEIFRTVKTEKDTASLIRKLRVLIRKSFDGANEEERKMVTDVDKTIEGQVRSVSSPWFRFFLTYDPRPALRNVKCPVLAINGEKDLQVPPKENLYEIKKALTEGGNKHFLAKELPGMNHLFQIETTGSPAEYGAIEETMSPEALKVIGDWIEQQVKR